MHGNRALWIIDLRKGAADICAEAPQNFLLSFPAQAATRFEGGNWKNGEGIEIGF
jgi:hypothetical protein